MAKLSPRSSANRTPSRRSTPVLDHKPVDAVCLVLLEHAIARRFAEGAEIRDRAWIGGKDFQAGALWQAGQGFSGLEDRQGAGKALQIQRFVGHRGLPNGALRRVWRPQISSKSGSWQQ